MTTEMLELEQEKRPGGMLEAFLMKPCDRGPITKDLEGEHVAFRNNMQFVLALRDYGDTQDHAVVKAWLTKHSADFGEAFDEIIGEDPRFFDGYGTLGDIPEDKWQKIEKLIYKQ